MTDTIKITYIIDSGAISRWEIRSLPHTSEEERIEWAKNRINKVLQTGIYAYTDANNTLILYPPARIYECRITMDYSEHGKKMD